METDTFLKITSKLLVSKATNWNKEDEKCATMFTQV